MSVNHQQEQLIMHAKRNQNKEKTTESIKNDNGVTITVYIESKTTRSHQKSSKPIKIKSSAMSTTGYDRRAQLLAYSRMLREAKNGDCYHQVQWPRTSSKSPKAKAKLRIGFLEDVQKGRQRGTYERVATEEDDSSIIDKRSKKKKKASSNKRPLCRRLSCMLKDLLGCQETTAL